MTVYSLTLRQSKDTYLSLGTSHEGDTPGHSPLTPLTDLPGVITLRSLVDFSRRFKFRSLRRVPPDTNDFPPPRSL